MGRLTERIVAIFLGVFLLAYVAYQAYWYFYRPVTTETVFEYNVTRSVYGRGIAVRDETVLEDNAGGVENYLYEDATRVSVGQTVAEFYRSSTGDQNVQRARELEEEIRLLREAQEPAVANIGNTEIYNRDIKDYVGRLSVMSSSGSFSDLADIKRSLITLVNKKMVSTGKVTDYENRIASLEEDLEQLRRSAAGETVTSVKAPESGYFSRMVDGYENRALMRMASEYTLNDYLEMIHGNAPAGIGGKVGKLVLNQNWYFAVAVQKDEIEWVKNGRMATLQFDHLAAQVPATLTKVLEHRGSETAVMLFRCDTMTADVINLRKSGVQVHFEQINGLRVNTADLRFDEENRRGVYILDDNIVRFRLVEPLYEESSFLLSEIYYVDSQDREHVKLFDQVITKGTDLYDGKPIQDN